MHLFINYLDAQKRQLQLAHYFYNSLISMENNTKSAVHIDVATVVQAFEALGAHTSSQQVIRSADQYILQCEQVP